MCFCFISSILFLKMELLKTIPFGESGLHSSTLMFGDNIKRQNCVHRSEAVIIRVIVPCLGCPSFWGSSEQSLSVIQLILDVGSEGGDGPVGIAVYDCGLRHQEVK